MSWDSGCPLQYGQKNKILKYSFIPQYVVKIISISANVDVQNDALKQ